MVRHVCLICRLRLRLVYSDGVLKYKLLFARVRGSWLASRIALSLLQIWGTGSPADLRSSNGIITEGGSSRDVPLPNVPRPPDEEDDHRPLLRHRFAADGVSWVKRVGRQAPNPTLLLNTSAMTQKFLLHRKE